MNVASMLASTALAHGGRPAITWGSSTLTYAELDRSSAALAAGFARRGIRRGDRVALYMDNRPELLEVLLATLRIGAVIVPTNARATADELAFVVKDAGVALVVTDPAHVETAATAASDRPVATAGVDLDDWRAVDPEAAEEPADVDAEDLAWLFYTSGTTGRPKGAMLPHRALAFMVVSWLADLSPMDERDVVLHAAPLTHGAGFHALVATARGAHQVILDGPSFDADRTLDVLDEHAVTSTWLVPTQIVRLTEAATARGRSRPATLRHVVYGGAPISTGALERAIDAFGPVFVQLYAQGESPMTITSLAAHDHHADNLGSAGRPRVGLDVRLIDESGRPLRKGEVGEVAVRGPSVMTGYWQRPDATSDALLDGWLRTGDLGRFDERGYLYLLDRTKDLIISGGSNVYAAEVEAVLTTIPHIGDVAVVGVPDELWGERVEAAVVLQDGAELDEQRLDAACRAKLAGYKVPRRYHVLDALPRNAYGKVLKTELRSRLAVEPLTSPGQI